ncbi:hypothetical protein GCM10007363_30750 [Pseudomonas fluvialis]|uniref:Uncharacterized protein n=1 Tax=Pseudomonas fluvialis TaxID=1793966 RepID=A0ABQ2AX08_9PSED|nr:hypothetical protein GCM10007363_30750 [Pseudomonas fluvialis]
MGSIGWVGSDLTEVVIRFLWVRLNNPKSTNASKAMKNTRYTLNTNFMFRHDLKNSANNAMGAGISRAIKNDMATPIRPTD